MQWWFEGGNPGSPGNLKVEPYKTRVVLGWVTFLALRGSTQTPKYPDWRFKVPNPACPDDPSIIQGLCEV